MSTATESKLHGKFDEVTGKVKQSFGEATHNEKLANEGATQQIKGHTEQAWGAVKGATQDAAADVKARHEAEGEHKAHDVRESLVSTAQNVKNHIQESVDNFRSDHK